MLWSLIKPTCELYPARLRIISKQQLPSRRSADGVSFGGMRGATMRLDPTHSCLKTRFDVLFLCAFSLVSLIIQVIVGTGAAGRPRNTRRRFFAGLGILSRFLLQGPVFVRLRAPLTTMELFVDLS